MVWYGRGSLRTLGGASLGFQILFSSVGITIPTLSNERHQSSTFCTHGPALSILVVHCLVTFEGVRHATEGSFFIAWRLIVSDILCLPSFAFPGLLGSFTQ